VFHPFPASQLSYPACLILYLICKSIETHLFDGIKQMAFNGLPPFEPEPEHHHLLNNSSNENLRV